MHCMPLLAALVLALATSASGTTTTACDCNAVPMVNKPVCGADGNTFMNRCLARCQGVAVAHNQPCNSASGPQIVAADAAAGGALRAAVGSEALMPIELGMAAAAAATVALGFPASSSATLTQGQMTRYAHENLVLVGTLNPVKDFDPSDLPTPDPNQRDPIFDQATSAAAEVSVTPDGCIYKQRMPLRQVLAARQAIAQAQAALEADTPLQAEAAAAAASLFADAAIPPVGAASDAVLEHGAQEVGAASEGASGRRLKTIFGKDDRQQITGQQPFPYSAVGLISFSVDNIGKGCTGAVIGPQAVLTAAHCVCSPKNKNVVAASWRFAPNHIYYGPDARYGWSSATRYSFNTGFWTTQWWLYDIAVVIIDKPLGDQTGMFGYAWSPGGVVGGLATAGYPGDKTYGSYWSIDASICKVNDTNADSVMLVHKCDVYAGQSGSPQWQLELDEKGQVKNRLIRAVINAEMEEYNSSMKINQIWFNFIKEKRTLKQ